MRIVPQCRAVVLASSLASGCGSGGSGDPSSGDGSTTAPATGSTGGMGGDCMIDPTVGDHVIECEGLTYYVHVPSACASEVCGVVVEVHGRWVGADATDVHTQTRSRGEEHGYIVIQPEARADDRGPSFNEVNDPNRIHAFVTDAVAAWGADPARVHVTGFSQGGAVTFALLCRYGESYASFAPTFALFTNGCRFDELQAPPVERPLLVIAGRLDAVTPFSAVEAGVQNMIGLWALAEGPPVSADDRHDWRRLSSPSGTTVEIIEHDYVTDPMGPLASNEGHCYAGSPAEGTEGWNGLACQGPTAFNQGEAVMQFFLDHPLP